MNELEAKLLRCLFVKEASDWFMGRSFIRFMRRARCLSVFLTITFVLPLLYLISIPFYAVYGTLVGAIGCLVLFLVLLILSLSFILHLFIFFTLVLFCLLAAAFTLTIGMYVLPVVLTCYDRSRFILHMKVIESTFSAFPQIVVMIVYLTEFPAGPGVIVSLTCSCVSIAFAFIKAFWIDSCHDASDFRSEVGTFRRRNSRKRNASHCSSRSEAFHECREDAEAARLAAAEGNTDISDCYGLPLPPPPHPPPAYPSLDLPISATTGSFGEVSVV